jgi:inosose dehydratase
MNRRAFLTTSTALLAGGTLQAAAPTFTLGFSLYGMRALSLREGIAHCAKVGYEAVELAALPGWPADPALLNTEQRREIRRLLADHKLALPAIMENWPLDAAAKPQDERIHRVSELAHALNPDAPPLIETILGGKPDQWEMVKNAFADRLGAWAKHATTAKSVIAIKAHRFGAVNRPEQVRWLLDQVKSKHLVAVYDWSHFEQRDMTLKDTVQVLASATKFVHVKDTIVDKGTAQFVLPGQGKTDYTALLQALVAVKYSGCVCVEVSGMVSGAKGYDPRKAAETCYQYLAPRATTIRTGKPPPP